MLKADRQFIDEDYNSGVERFHLQRWTQADSLLVEVGWKQFAREVDWKSSSVVLRFERVDVPMAMGVREMSSDKWVERVTFTAEENMTVYGEDLAIFRIENFMFPGFTPETSMTPSLSPALQVGTHTTMFNEYEIQYSIFHYNNTYGLSIHSISLPVRNLMLFSVPHLVGSEVIFSDSTAKIRYTSPLFNTIIDELLSLPSSILAERQRDDYSRWKDSMKPLCEICALEPLDRYCEMTLCEVCCSRQGGCISHLAKAHGKKVPRRKVVEVPVVLPDVAEGEWGDADGQEAWGKDLTASNLSESETLADDNMATSFLKMYGWEYQWMFEEAVIIPPPMHSSWEDRPKSCGAIEGGDWEVKHSMRRVNSCL